MRHPPLVASIALSLTVLALRLPAQAHAGHPPAEQLGTVHFATSCASAIGPRFDRAVALLHSFEFGAAIRAFDEVLAIWPLVFHAPRSGCDDPLA